MVTRQSVRCVPIGAVLPETRDRFAVFVFDPETSTVAKRGVEPGGVGDDSIAILAGLEEGEIIATAGVSFLRDGQTVTLLGDELVRDAP